jgi:hypothetical protein
MSLFQSLAVRKAQNGKRFASGTLTPADEDVDVVTGLATVDHGGVALAAVPTLSHTYSAATPSSTAGSLNILSFGSAASDDATPAVSGTEVAVTWWAVGEGEL